MPAPQAVVHGPPLPTARLTTPHCARCKDPTFVTAFQSAVYSVPGDGSAFTAFEAAVGPSIPTLRGLVAAAAAALPAATDYAAVTAALAIGPAGMASKVTPDAQRGITLSRVRHCMSTLAFAASHQARLLDVEGTRLGLAVGPADIVGLAPDGSIVLVDIGTPGSAAHKRDVVTSWAEQAARAWPGTRFTGEVIECRRPAVAFVEAQASIALVRHNTSAVTARGMAVARAVKRLGLEYWRSVAAAYRSALPNAYPKHAPGAVPDWAYAAATGLPTASQVGAAYAWAGERYPKLAAVLSAYADPAITKATRGGPVCAAPPADALPRGPYLFMKLMNDTTDSFVCMAADGAVSSGAEAVHGAVVSWKRVNGRSGKLTLADTAPQPFHDFLCRAKSPPSPRTVGPAGLGHEAVTAAYALATAAADLAGQHAAAHPASMSTMASVVLASADIHLPANLKHEACVDAGSAIVAAAATVGMSQLAFARELSEAASASCVISSGDLVSVYSGVGASSYYMVRRTGSLSTDNDTAVVAACYSPEGFSAADGNWVAERDGDYVLTKAILSTPAAREFFGTAEARVAVIAAAEATGAEDTLDAGYAGRLAAIACHNRKPLQVALKLWRNGANSALSLASELDDLAAKFDVTAPQTRLEQYALMTLIVRCLGLAAHRDNVQLGPVTQTHPATQRRCVTIASPLARRPCINAAGLANTYYEYNLSTGISSSHTMAAATALAATVEHTTVWEAALSRALTATQLGAVTDHDWAFGMTRATFDVAGGTGLEEYLRQPATVAAEISQAVAAVTDRRKPYCNMLLHSVYACLARHENKASLDSTAAHRACQADLTSIATTKKIFAPSAAQPTRTATAALAVQAKLSRDRGLSPPDPDRVTVDLYRDIMSNEAARPIVLSTEMLSAGKHDEVQVSIVEKIDSIEKPRDIAMIHVDLRPAQRCIEQVSKLCGQTLAESALHGLHRHDTLRQMASTTQPGVADIVLHAATDKSAYGPTKMAAQLYSGLNPFLETGSTLDHQAAAVLGMLDSKRVFPCAAVADAAHEDLMRHAQGWAAYSARAGRHREAVVKTGMMQGLFQNTADLATAASTFAFKDILRGLGYRVEACTTNDDGAARIVVPVAQAPEAAEYVRMAVLYSGFPLGEPANTSKLAISTIVADLNTHLVVQGEEVLPFVRSLIAAVTGAPCASTRASAMQALTSTNAAVYEGADTRSLLVASAFAWAHHYRSFNMSADSLPGLSPNCMLLGRAIISPYVVSQHGPAAVADAVETDASETDLISSIAAMLVSARGAAETAYDAPAASSPPEGGVMTNIEVTGLPTAKGTSDALKAMADVSSVPARRLLDLPAVPTFGSHTAHTARVAHQGLMENMYDTKYYTHARAAAIVAASHRRAVATYVTVGADGGLVTTRATCQAVGYRPSLRRPTNGLLLTGPASVILRTYRERVLAARVAVQSICRPAVLQEDTGPIQKVRWAPVPAGMPRSELVAAIAAAYGTEDDKRHNAAVSARLGTVVAGAAYGGVSGGYTLASAVRSRASAESVAALLLPTAPPFAYTACDSILGGQAYGADAVSVFSRSYKPKVRVVYGEALEPAARPALGSVREVGVAAAEAIARAAAQVREPLPGRPFTVTEQSLGVYLTSDGLVAPSRLGGFFAAITMAAVRRQVMRLSSAGVEALAEHASERPGLIAGSGFSTSAAQPVRFRTAEGAIHRGLWATQRVDTGKSYHYTHAFLAPCTPTAVQDGRAWVELDGGKVKYKGHTEAYVVDVGPAVGFSIDGFPANICAWGMSGARYPISEVTVCEPSELATRTVLDAHVGRHHGPAASIPRRGVAEALAACVSSTPGLAYSISSAMAGGLLVPILTRVALAIGERVRAVPGGVVPSTAGEAAYVAVSRWSADQAHAAAIVAAPTIAASMASASGPARSLCLHAGVDREHYADVVNRLYSAEAARRTIAARPMGKGATGVSAMLSALAGMGGAEDDDDDDMFAPLGATAPTADLFTAMGLGPVMLPVNDAVQLAVAVPPARMLPLPGSSAAARAGLALVAAAYQAYAADAAQEWGWHQATSLASEATHSALEGRRGALGYNAGALLTVICLAGPARAYVAAARAAALAAAAAAAPEACAWEWEAFGVRMAVSARKVIGQLRPGAALVTADWAATVYSTVRGVQYLL